MRIQESLVADKQIALELVSENGKYRLPIKGKDYYFPSLEKVHKAFLNQSTYDTIKLTHNGNKSYLHLFMDEIEVFDTKKALRQRLSQDSQGMWAEIRNGKTHYYMQQRGWTSTSYKEITEQECLEKLRHTSTMTKALGIGLGILALLPGAMEFARHLPIGTKEAAMGLIALNQKSPFLGAVGYSLLPKAAEAQAVGTEFQVNTYTTGNQKLPSVAPLNDGGFVVTWQSSGGSWGWSSTGQDGDLSGIIGQRYDSSGVAAGTEFQVNTYTTSWQEAPSIAPLSDGGFVVIWESLEQDGDNWGIYGQRFDSFGTLVGAEFQINSYTTSIQQNPSVAPLKNGGFVVTWDSSGGQDGDLNGIFGQRYNSSGVAAGTEFQVNTYTTGNQKLPSVAPLNDGGFVVVWESDEQDGDGLGIFGQRYDSSGMAAGSEFQVNTYTTNWQYSPSVASLIDGGFVVTWASSGMYAQRYASNGVLVGSEFQVNTYSTISQNNPRVAPLNDGGFVVVWESDEQDGDLGGIFGQRYDNSGVAVGAEFQINTYTTSAQISPNIAPLNDGGFVVTWRSEGQDGDRSGIFGQRFNASGDAIPLQLPTSTTATVSSTQGSPSQNTLSRSFGTTQTSSTSSITTASKTPSPSPVTTETIFGSSTPISPTLGLTPNSSTAAPSTTSQNLGTAGSKFTAFSTSPTNSRSQTPAITWSSPTSSTATSISIAATRPTSSSPTIASVEKIVYGESYPIFENDQVVGTYSVSGGTGLLNSSNSNVIYFEFDPSFQPEEGETITLFYLPDEEAALWESIEIEGENYECLEARGQVATNQGRYSYQMVFEDTECLTIAPRIALSTLPLTLN